MKKKLICTAVACLSAIVLCFGVMGSSFAAGQKVAVKLDGTAIDFGTGAKPLVKNGRTYVPFRTIFEAMGATVAWDAETRTVSAARDGTVVAFEVGKTAVTVTEQGEQRTARTDAASFIENGSTFVPVRFAAQAFGADVGWDNNTQTVLIVDAAKLTQTYAGKFSVMDRYLAFAMPENSRAVNGETKLLYTAHTAAGDIMIPMTIKFAATMDKTSAYFTLQTTTDIESLKQALSANENAVAENIANLFTELEKASFEGVLSREDSALYLKGSSLKEFGVPEGKWVRMPLDAALSTLTNGALNEAALTGIVRHSFTQYVVGAAANVKLTDANMDTVSLVRTAADTLYATLSDERFTAVDNILIADNTSTTSDGATVKESMRFTTDESGAIIAAEQEKTVTKNNQTVLKSLQNQDVFGNQNKSIEIHTASYSANITTSLHSAPSSNTPLRRPTVDIVP